MNKYGVLAVLVFFTVLWNSAFTQNVPDVQFPQADGFKLTPGEKVYTPDNLFEIIDGAADLFLTYGFEKLYTAEYSAPGIRYIRIETYRHSSPANAFGMYAQERPEQTRFLPIGGQGYMEEGVLNFYCGRYYVRMSTNDTGENVRNALQSIAQSVAGALHQEKMLPALFGFFPQEGKKQNSEMYVNQDFLGYNFFPAAYSVQYAGEKLFIIDFSGVEAARLALKKYFGLLQMPAQNSPENIPENITENPVAVNDPHQGSVMFRLCGARLAGAADIRDAEAAKRNLDALVRAFQGAH